MIKIHRIWQFIVILFCSFSVLFAVYLQQYHQQNPCPLCIIQRLVFIVLGLIAFINIWCQPTKWFSKSLYFLSDATCCLGFYFSGRQIYLQHLPPEKLTTCVPNWDVLVQIMPIQQVAKILFLGTGDCARVTWRLLGLSLAELAFIGFLFILLGNLICFVLQFTRNR